MNHDPQCPLCGFIHDTDNIKICKYHAWVLSTPELNHREAEEVSEEDLLAAAEFYDNFKNPKNENLSNL